MAAPKSITCQCVGHMVYVRDEYGNLFDTFSFPQNVIAQSFGNGMSVICGTMCYTYVLENGQLKQTSVHSA